MSSHERVFIAGGTGLVGGALVRRLGADSSREVLAPTRVQVDLSVADEVDAFLQESRPDTVILAAALVGGIAANQARPVEFLTENLVIQNNVMLGAHRAGVTSIMFLGSSCIYPRDCPQPMREAFFMTGPLEPTNESYAVAKIAGIRLAEALKHQFGMKAFLPMPSNIYGPGDHFDPEKSHVLSALVMRFEEARRRGSDHVTLWGTGAARREFLHCDDLADACAFLLDRDEDLGIINIGSGTDISIADLALLIAEEVGFEGAIKWDHTKPDGMPRKLMNVDRMNDMGWKARIPLDEGVRTVIREYRRLFPEH